LHQDYSRYFYSRPFFVGEEMILCTQVWQVRSPGREHDLSECVYPLSLCHYSCRWKYCQLRCRAMLSDLIRCQISHQNHEMNCWCKELHRCSGCGLEIQIQIKDFAELGNALIFTVWRNVGSESQPYPTNWRFAPGSDRFLPKPCAEIHIGEGAGVTKALLENEYPGYFAASMTQENLERFDRFFRRQFREGYVNREYQHVDRNKEESIVDTNRPKYLPNSPAWSHSTILTIEGLTRNVLPINLPARRRIRGILPSA
jgi:hypothetical protein